MVSVETAPSGTGTAMPLPATAITAGFNSATVVLDQYEVRRWDGWYRHITLAMLAQAYLAVIRHQAMEQGEKGAATVPMKS